jgi:hypothetical protein
LASVLLNVALAPSLADELGKNARYHYVKSCLPEQMVSDFMAAIHQAGRGLNARQ